VRGRKKCAELRGLLGLQLVDLVIVKDKLRQLGHAECICDAGWIKCCMTMEAGGTRCQRKGLVSNLVSWSI